MTTYSSVTYSLDGCDTEMHCVGTTRVGTIEINVGRLLLSIALRQAIALVRKGK